MLTRRIIRRYEVILFFNNLQKIAGNEMRRYGKLLTELTANVDLILCKNYLLKVYSFPTNR